MPEPTSKKKDNDTSLPEAADRVIVRKKKSCHPVQRQVHDCGGQPLFRFLRNRRLPLLNCKKRISPYTVVNIQADFRLGEVQRDGLQGTIRLLDGRGCPVSTAVTACTQPELPVAGAVVKVAHGRQIEIPAGVGRFALGASTMMAPLRV